MSGQIRIKAADGFGCADTSNDILAREKLQGPVNGRGRQSPEVTQPFIDRVGCWMSSILDEGAIDGEPLRSDSNAPGPAQLLEVIAPLIYIGRVPAV